MNMMDERIFVDRGLDNGTLALLNNANNSWTNNPLNR